MVTFLSILFLIFLVSLIFYGYGFIVAPSKSKKDVELEKCTVCNQKFAKVEMILRQVGDFKLIYFCKTCIQNLSEEIKN